MWCGVGSDVRLSMRGVDGNVNVNVKGNGKGMVKGGTFFSLLGDAIVVQEGLKNVKRPLLLIESGAAGAEQLPTE